MPPPLMRRINPEFKQPTLAITIDAAMSNLTWGLLSACRHFSVALIHSTQYVKYDNVRGKGMIVISCAMCCAAQPLVCKIVEKATEGMARP